MIIILLPNKTKITASKLEGRIVNAQLSQKLSRRKSQKLFVSHWRRAQSRHLVFLAIGCHGQRTVGQVIRSTLLRFNDKCIRPGPVLPVNHWLQHPSLIGPIAHRHASWVTGSHVTNEVQNLRNKVMFAQNYWNVYGQIFFTKYSIMHQNLLR